MDYEFINENNLIYQFDEIEFIEENKEKILKIWKDYNYYYNYYNYYNYNYYYNYYNYYNYNSIEEIQFFLLSSAYFQDQLDRIISNETKRTSYEID